MNDDYIWNRSGTPDPDVARLEALLEPLRHRPSTLDFSRVPAGSSVSESSWTSRYGALAIAASLVLAVATGLWATWRWRTPDATAGPWVATEVHGAPTVDSGRLRRDTRIAPDEWIETDPTSGVRLTAESVGTVEVRPGSRIRIVPTGSGQYRLALAKGSLRASIWAPPGQFAVETASGVALDLGCIYSLEVDGQGAGRLRVASGWVGLDSHGAESLVPAGASCTLRAGLGPGTPCFDDAPEALVEAVSQLDRRPAAAPLASVRAAVAAARSRDGFTLWHLLWRLDGDGAALVYERLLLLAPPPPFVTRQRVLAKDRDALEAWWESLGLGSSSLFKMWRARPAL